MIRSKSKDFDLIDIEYDNNYKNVKLTQITSNFEAITRARMAFVREVTKSVDFRIAQLNAVYRMVDENSEQIVDALKQDLRKPTMEAVLTEVEFVKNDVKDQLLHIKEYMRPKPVDKNIVVMMDDAYIHYEPYGLVLIIGPWNYPVQLCLGPLIGAITAGNCAVIKPSEISDNVQNVLAQLIPKYLDNECYHVITGGPEATQHLLKERFDYIFFTGSTTVGRLVNEAAAKHMTPVTLELGGKSPLFLDDTVSNFDVAVKRILWGKFLNCGQTCVAPDYLLCTPKVQSRFVDTASRLLKQFYGDNPQKSPDLGRIINSRHFERISQLLNASGKVAVGSDRDGSDKYISPTILTDVSNNDPIMNEEIFGPILPIVTVSSANEAIDFIKRGEKPLTLYVFSSNDTIIKKFVNETTSGSMCVNDAVFHLTVDTLPFGGVGASGIGRYHGRASFETFSNPKSVLVRNYNPVLEAIGSARYPPYTSGKLRFMNQLLAKRKDYTPKYWSQYLMYALGVITMLSISSIYM